MLASKYFQTYTVAGTTATAGTAITAAIPPFGGGPGVPCPLYQVDSAGKPLWVRGTGAVITHLVNLSYLTAGTAHTINVLRPLNFTYLTAAVAAGTTALPVAGDPGIYSTNYLYALPGGTGTANGPSGPSSVSDDGAASGDYVMYQLLDGTWQVDTVSSYSSGTLTVNTGTPTPTVSGNGGCYKNGVVFFFGVGTDTDPATNQKQPAWTTTASTTAQYVGNTYVGGVAGLHYGDPLLFVSNNITAAGTLVDATAAYMIH